MNQNIIIVAFGTFGNPNGFKQSFLSLSDKNIARGIKTFDLNTNAIKVFPASKVYSIRKEVVNGFNAIAYTVYTFAKEQNSDRGGTFIGSSILYLNKISEENITINCLNEFHNSLVSKYVENDIIVVNHSDNFTVAKPKDFDKLNYHPKEVEDLNFVQSSNNNLVVYSKINPDNLQQLFKKSIDLLNVYDTIYFTDNEEVATFVNQKRIFKLANSENVFEQEIKNLLEERIRKTQSSIGEFENEKQKLEIDKTKLIEEFKYQIEQNEKSHQENSKIIVESKNELSQIIQKYDAYSKIIDKSIQDLKSKGKLEEVRQIHNSNKRKFIDSINQQTKPNYNVNKIPKHKARTELKQSFQPSHSNLTEEDSYKHERTNRKSGNPKSDIFKLLAFAFFLLWLGTLAFFLFFHNTENTTAEVESQLNQTSTVEPPKVAPVPIKELIPKPNAELTEKEYKIVAKKITKDMPLKDIVQIIYEANPSDIKNNYSAQIEEYSKKLIELNKDCFKVDSSKFLFSKDTLRHIPSYKKPK